MYRINQAIRVAYQAQNAKSGLTIDMDVYDEAQILDVAKSVSGMTHLASGRYEDTFTPDATGDWIVMIYERGKPLKKSGSAVKLFRIADHDVELVGDNVDALSGDVLNMSGDILNLSGDIDDLGSPAMVG